MSTHTPATPRKTAPGPAGTRTIGTDVPATMRASILKRRGDRVMETLPVPQLRQLVADGKVDLDILAAGKFALAEAEDPLKAGKQTGQLKAVVYPGR